MLLFKGLQFETMRELIDFAMYDMAMQNPERAQSFGYSITFTK